MHLLGKLPRDHKILIQRMNALQQELRKQLAKVEQGPSYQTVRVKSGNKTNHANTNS